MSDGFLPESFRRFIYALSPPRGGKRAWTGTRCISGLHGIGKGTISFKQRSYNRANESNRT